MGLADNKGFGKTKGTKPPPPPEQATIKAENANMPTDHSLSKSTGAEALARLRQANVEQRNEELRSIRDLKNVDRQLLEAPNSAVIPEKVAQRMGKRMIPFVGLPLFGLTATFVTFWYMATYKDYEFQTTLVAFSTIGILVISLSGITYSVMSASWDEDVEGGFFGMEEFRKNVRSIRDGLKRSQENAILREKMSTIPDDEINYELESLKKQEKFPSFKKLSYEEKFEEKF